MRESYEAETGTRARVRRAIGVSLFSLSDCDIALRLCRDFSALTLADLRGVPADADRDREDGMRECPAVGDAIEALLTGGGGGPMEPIFLDD